MERFERRKHGLDVVVAVEEPARLLEALVPELVPEDRDADELLADEERLLDEVRTVVPHLVHDNQRGLAPRRARVLGRDRERVDERLRVRLADVDEHVLDELANVRARRVDPRDELQVRESVEVLGGRGAQASWRTCGMTSSQVSTLTVRKPSEMASVTIWE